MIQKKKNKKKIGVILCAMFICLCSILCIIPFNKQEKIEVYADEVSVTTKTFTSSPILVPIVYSSSSYSFNFRDEFVDAAYVSFEFNVNSLNEIISMNYLVSATDYNNGDQNFTFYRRETVNTIIHSSNVADNSFTVFNHFFDYNDGLNIPSTYAAYVVFRTAFYTMQPYSQDNLYYVPKFVDFNSVMLSNGAYDGYDRTTFSYYNSSGQLQFFNSVFCPGALQLYSSREYYFSNNYNFTDNEYYNQGYSAGESAGYNSGYSAGESVGYNNGFNVGNTTGYNNGYSDGLEDSNQYTFLSLLSATIDAPVKYFQSLFNFELLGVNLQGFLTGLFTLCVIVTIIKLCLGG